VDETEDRFPDVVRGLREGDPEVLARFFARYGPAIERVAARRLSPGLRRRIGPESIAQSVCRTFLRRAQGGEFEIPDADSLWGLLSAIALTKVQEQVRFHRREKRAVDREVLLDEGATERTPGPTHEEEALFADEFEHLVAGMSEEERRIVDLRLMDRTQVEIAEELGVSERTVRRIMTRLEARLLEEFARA
jgi:RNA polymerase sigma-70 factor (ECF subfamily)